MGTNRETKGRGVQLPVSESSISPNSVFKLHAVEEQGSPAHEHLEAVHRGKGRDSETEKATGQTSRPDFSSARPPQVESVGCTPKYTHSTFLPSL